MTLLIPGRGCCAGAASTPPCEAPTVVLDTSTAPILTTATTGTDPLTFSWYYIHPETHLPAPVPWDGADIDLTGRPDGQYYVIVSNCCGQAMSEVYAWEACVPPTAIVEPAEGISPQLLTALATGTPPFTYQWQILDIPTMLWLNIYLATADTYLADPVVQSFYRVIVTNDCGTAESGDVTVNPAGPPPGDPEA